jgi:hypothetical protein
MGQIIMLDHERDVGAELLAGSLTELVLHWRSEGNGHCGPRRKQPLVAYVNMGSLPGVEAAAHPEPTITRTVLEGRLGRQRDEWSGRRGGGHGRSVQVGAVDGGWGA